VALGVDTNVLLRVIVEDDPRQQKKAKALLDGADQIAVGDTCLCELAWVLSRAYRQPPASIAMVIRRIVAIENVIIDRSAVDAGLKMLDAGGDFADGIIAFHGRQLGGDTFVSFDKKAVELVKTQGHPARLL
jgi:predicted nucleic-acid-binding protein